MKIHFGCIFWVHFGLIPDTNFGTESEPWLPTVHLTGTKEPFKSHNPDLHQSLLSGCFRREVS